MIGVVEVGDGGNVAASLSRVANRTILAAEAVRWKKILVGARRRIAEAVPTTREA